VGVAGGKGGGLVTLERASIQIKSHIQLAGLGPGQTTLRSFELDCSRTNGGLVIQTSPKMSFHPGEHVAPRTKIGIGTGWVRVQTYHLQHYT